ncbi:MAG: nicotinate (nicotinamide) nucleotide adenylyltransferase [Omnitrophica WOR_2 bacterium RIFCSPHIGHO2_01_FULL_48_9]|nr:MAG: nicotinate (nicotinamide) nucleotide adenylyltransferase [Omnitrophica WOR_2 bacterium RIFCSPHIGHO2_02_FULL_48_11]OGX32495.1 MAG: nicotinate (nicotinamide) nucleotide adenylyltransferase [Omnitrophica WOR_2 bacterium RIFCSPHIGHO2_01_FULL_48_9]
MRRIGLLGGTFNPIHIGHLTMAQVAMERMNLDKIIFIPSCIPPHKKIKNLAAARHRYNMVRLALQGNPDFAVSNFEIQKAGKSYSIDTVRYFRKKYPRGTKLFFIIGADALAGLRDWKNIDQLLKLVTFVVVNRPGYIYRGSRIRYKYVAMPDIDIASSFLRSRVAEGRSIKYFVPDKVFAYIKKHRLYKE